jgi:YidC/Oxa1 family membrane protein insertase
MEKRTLLAVALSMMIMLGFWALQDMLFPRPEPVPQPPEQRNEQPQWPQENITLIEETAGPSSDIMLARDITENIPLETVIIETEAVRVVLSNAGGNIVSYQLMRHLDRGQPVEMILAGDAGPQAFAVAFGNWEDVLGRRVSPIASNFRVNRVSDLIVEFSQIFTVPEGGHFTLVKRYEFQPGEYMFELTISLTGGEGVHYFNFGDAGYTLIFSPQIGPRFTRLDERYEYRRYMTFRGGRLRTERVNERAPTVITNQPAWAAIVGKYFALAAMPYVNNYDLVFATHQESGIPAASRLFIERPAVFSSRVEDKYHFYLGPKNQENLVRYERGENGFRLRDTGLTEIASNSGFWAILSPLENGLKWLLMLFYGLIPNYGVAIILVTLAVKLVMFPLTKKSSESTLRMQALAPRIKEIQEKHKGNPQKTNQEMAEFYKREGYNPLSGCLPMLLQLPIFFAMFQLFNNHFDLRGAMFIPGWITDLSVPESVFDFPDGFSLPLLGWTAIRILPFIYVGSQLLYGKVVSNPAQQGSMQMKIMLYAMPIVFFFILYEMPSGLLIYWIMSNILTLVQQVIINKYMIRKKAAAAAAAPVVETKQIIAPPGGGKKKKKR